MKEWFKVWLAGTVPSTIITLVLIIILKASILYIFAPAIVAIGILLLGKLLFMWFEWVDNNFDD